MEGIGTCIATKLAECLWDPISRHARYLFCFNKFIGDVEKTKGELEVKLADVNKRKEDADLKTEKIMPSVENWLKEVNAILEEVQKQELEGGGNKCFNVSLRYSLAKQMEDKANKMKELKSNSSFEPFSLLIPLAGINTQLTSKEWMYFESRKSTYNSLLEAIKDGKNKMVGLYGMGGSGKTTLAIEVGKEVEQLKIFDKVVKVVVSQHPNVRNIQEEIKEKTGLKFEWPTTDEARGERLLIGLRSMKVLIILDDVWRDLNLQEIGILPNENFRILLTTRLRDVCESMRCDKTFKLSLLTREEAWALLMTHANLTHDSFNEFVDVGREIVDECKGLPIAVVTMGSALRGKGIVVWNSTLRRLQHSLPLDVDEGSRGPFACLKLSYDYLPSLAKQLFLLCSMFPEDHEIHIEDLIRFGKGTLEFEDIAYAMEDARNEIFVSINKLLDSCLLMHTNKQAYVKMHDLVRDVALWITKKQHQAILVDRDVVSRTLVENETLKETKAISLWNLEKNFKLSNQLRCPTLEILLLHSGDGFIKDLGGIEPLKVLALVTFSFEWIQYYRRRIQWSMPQSILLSLMNLHILCFRGIVLGDISFLCHLKRLEILDLHGSQFVELPCGIVEMKKLKLLDVFRCEIEKSPLEVIQKCEELEELYILDGKSAIPENFSLSRLKRYAIYDSRFRPNIDSKWCYIRSPFRDYYDEFIEALRALWIEGFKVSRLNLSMKDLILRANYLCLQNCMWDHKDINVNIKHLLASNCPEKRFIVDSLGTDVLQTRQVFPHLITLKLEEMNSLEQVFQDSLTIRCSLPMLQELVIEGCPELTAIFTHATIISLPKLRTLQISDCDKVKYLAIHCPSLEELQIYSCYELESLIQEEVAHGDRLLHQRESHHGNETKKITISDCSEPESLDKEASHEDVLLPLLKLKTLILFDLPKLRKIFGGRFKHKLESLHNKQEYSPHVVNLELISIDLNGLLELDYIWKGPTQSVSLHRLERVTLVGCSKLRNIFTLTIVTSLPELRRLKIRECEEWEGIFCEESLKNLSSSYSSSSNVCFPKLQNIEISQCDKVKRLFSYSLASHCPSLEKITIEDCSKLEGLDEEASHEDILLPLPLKLKTLTLRWLPKLREIFGWRFEHKLESLHNKQECSLQKHKNERMMVVNLELISIRLQGLPKWDYIWKGPTQFVSLHRLEVVELTQCSKIKHIFTFAIVTSLPELRTLTIDECDEWEGIFCEESLKNLSSSIVCLPRLKRIWIFDCHKVRRLFSYALASHCPSLEEITIYDCSQLEGVVQAYEGEVARHHEKLFPKLNDLNLRRLPELIEIYSDYEFNHLSGTIQIKDCPNICNIPL